MSIRSVNLNDPSTFIRSTITGEQASERLRILEVAQEALESAGRPLSPASTREMRELADLVVTAQDTVVTSRRIFRKEPATFYTVEYNPDPRIVAVRRFNAASERVTALVTYVEGGGRLIFCEP